MTERFSCVGTYWVQTFGCQMNDRDSEILAGLLEEMGYAPASDPETADIILFNTCCVRGNAENRLYGHLGNLKPLKEGNPKKILGVCGCMVQQPSELEKLEKDYPYVDLLFGTHNVHRLPQLLNLVLGGQRTIEVWDDKQAGIQEELPTRRTDPFRALVTVMYGCNNFCSYCIVPHVRGRERSRKPADILNEINQLASEGIKEVTLLGQNVNSYGKDLNPTFTFAELIREINGVEGIERIRFTTSHPKDLSDALIQAMAELPKVCEHLHLPVQSGSDRILDAMNRRYKREHYLELVKKLRKAVPDISMTTDIIVGFPGETEDDFQDTMDLVEQVKYDGAFTFAYSPRNGTKAAEFLDQVPHEVRMERLYRLNDLVNRLAHAANDDLVGTIQEVMVEGPSPKDPSIYTSRTRGNKQVLFRPVEEHGDLNGKLIFLKIIESRTWTLTGEWIDKTAHEVTHEQAHTDAPTISRH